MKGGGAEMSFVDRACEFSEAFLSANTRDGLFALWSEWSLKTSWAAGKFSDGLLSAIETYKMERCLIIPSSHLETIPESGTSRFLLQCLVGCRD